LLEHGGGVLAASRTYGRAPSEWLDLSTGISPFAWPVGGIPADVWQRLPEHDDGLLDAARDYYGTQALVAAAGSQALINALPTLRPPARVAIVSPTYAEHAHAWRRAGHSVRAVDYHRVSASLGESDVLVLCNPNNPTAFVCPREMLLGWHAQLAARAGWLVVDEAFADADASQSVVRDCGVPGLIVLRSVGKFFGLAGIRLGFVALWPSLAEALRPYLGPWPVNGPARWIGRRALTDRAWQQAQHETLRVTSTRLAARLRDAGLAPAGCTALFAWAATPEALALKHFFAERAILIRAFADPLGARFGLPDSPAAWDRLDRTLVAWTRDRS
jgi:cobalamin biosynthesis protein CobC